MNNDEQETLLYEARVAARNEMLRYLREQGMDPKAASDAVSDYGAERITAKISGFGNAEIRVRGLDDARLFGSIGVTTLASQVWQRLRHGPDPERELATMLRAAGMESSEATQRARKRAFRTAAGEIVGTLQDGRVHVNGDDALRRVARELLAEYRAEAAVPTPEAIAAKRASARQSTQLRYDL